MRRKEGEYLMLEEFLDYNKEFVDSKAYLKYVTSKHPDKKVAIVSCMDTRLTELLTASIGVKNGDAKVIKNVGGVFFDPYGSEMFGLLVAIYELGADIVFIIGHDDCGGAELDTNHILESMKAKGITERDFAQVGREFKAVEEWFVGFPDVDKAVRKTVNIVKNHPLMHEDVAIYGLIMNPETGQLREVMKKEATHLEGSFVCA